MPSQTITYTYYTTLIGTLVPLLIDAISQSVNHVAGQKPQLMLTSNWGAGWGWAGAGVGGHWMM